MQKPVKVAPSYEVGERMQRMPLSYPCRQSKIEVSCLMLCRWHAGPSGLQQPKIYIQAETNTKWSPEKSLRLSLSHLTYSIGGILLSPSELYKQAPTSIFTSILGGRGNAYQFIARHARNLAPIDLASSYGRTWNQPIPTASCRSFPVRGFDEVFLCGVANPKG